MEVCIPLPKGRVVAEKDTLKWYLYPAAWWSCKQDLCNFSLQGPGDSESRNKGYEPKDTRALILNIKEAEMGTLRSRTAMQKWGSE